METFFSKCAAGKQKYDLDQHELKKYLQLDKLRDGMFWVAGELFNFSFTPITNVPVYHPDMKVWEVKDKTSGRHIGLWYFDLLTADAFEAFLEGKGPYE